MHLLVSDYDESLDQCAALTNKMALFILAYDSDLRQEIKLKQRSCMVSHYESTVFNDYHDLLFPIAKINPPPKLVPIRFDDFKKQITPVFSYKSMADKYPFIEKPLGIYQILLASYYYAAWKNQGRAMLLLKELLKKEVWAFDYPYKRDKETLRLLGEDFKKVMEELELSLENKDFFRVIKLWLRQQTDDAFKDLIELKITTEDLKKIINSPVYGKSYAGVWYSLLKENYSYTVYLPFLWSNISDDLNSINLRSSLWALGESFHTPKVDKNQMFRLWKQMKNSSDFYLQSMAIEWQENEIFQQFLKQEKSFYPLFKQKRELYRHFTKMGSGIKDKALFELLQMGDIDPLLIAR